MAKSVYKISCRWCWWYFSKPNMSLLLLLGFWQGKSCCSQVNFKFEFSLSCHESEFWINLYMHRTFKELVCHLFLWLCVVIFGAKMLSSFLEATHPFLSLTCRVIKVWLMSFLRVSKHMCDLKNLEWNHIPHKSPSHHFGRVT